MPNLEIDPADAAAFQQQFAPKLRIEVTKSSPTATFQIDPADAAAFAQRNEPQGTAMQQQSAAPPQTSAAQRIAIDYQNQQEAAAQRTTPIIAAQQHNVVGPAMVNDAGEVGYRGPDGNFVPTDVNKHVVLTDPSSGDRMVYARTGATNEALLPSLGRLIGTGMGAGNIGGTVARTGPAAVEAAKQLGVEVPRAITGGPLTQYAGNLVSRLPGGSPLVEGITEAKQGLAGATQRAATEAAQGTVGEAAAGQDFRGAVANYFKPKVKDATGAAYDQVAQLVDANRTTPLGNTQGAIADIVARRGASGREDIGKAVNSVLGGATRPGGLTFNGIKDLRTSIGEMLDTSMFPEGMSQAELRQIYKGLSSDLEASAAANGPRALAAFQRANAFAANVEKWKEQIGKVIGPEQASGESIYNRIVRAATVGGSDENALMAARRAVPPEVWRNVAATSVSTLGRNRVGEWTPAAFLSDYRNLTEQGKRLLFGSVGRGDIIPFLDNIAETSKSFVESGRLANVSGTASHAGTYAALYSAAGGLAAGRLREPLAVIAALVGNNVAARILATPSTAAAMARWSRIYERVTTNPGPATMAALDRASRELVSTTNSSLGTNITPETISAPLKKNIQQPQQRPKQLPAH